MYPTTAFETYFINHNTQTKVTIFWKEKKNICHEISSILENVRVEKCPILKEAHFSKWTTAILW